MEYCCDSFVEMACWNSSNSEYYLYLKALSTHGLYLLNGFEMVDETCSSAQISHAKNAVFKTVSAKVAE